MEKMNIEQATQDWIDRHLSAVPTWLIEYAKDDLELLTPIDEGGCENNGLPMWGWMWMVRESWDAEWIGEHLEDMASFGFVVYDLNDELVLGIDGAGYNFMIHHWIPLYLQMGWRGDDADATAKWMKYRDSEIQSIPGLAEALAKHLEILGDPSSLA